METVRKTLAKAAIYTLVYGKLLLNEKAVAINNISSIEDRYWAAKLFDCIKFADAIVSNVELDIITEQENTLINILTLEGRKYTPNERISTYTIRFAVWLLQYQLELESKPYFSDTDIRNLKKQIGYNDSNELVNFCLNIEFNLLEVNKTDDGLTISTAKEIEVKTKLGKNVKQLIKSGGNTITITFFDGSPNITVAFNTIEERNTHYEKYKALCKSKK